MQHRRAILLVLLAATRTAPCLADGPAAALHAGAVVASHTLAARAGQQMLDLGGSATDAAIAAQMMLSVVAPQDSGLGGGAVMLHMDGPTRGVTAWNGREAAPAGEPAAPPPAPPHGARSVGVPGMAAMLEAAHKQHGRLPWPSLLAPAIQAAEAGVPVSPELARAIADHQDTLLQRPGTRAVFFDAGGAPLAAGATMINTELAQTLRAVATGGSAALMRGPVAADIATIVRTADEPGLLTTDDLAAYGARTTAATCEPYRTATICIPPAPSGGPVLLDALRRLAHAEWAALDPASAAAAEQVITAQSLAAAGRPQDIRTAGFAAAIDVQGNAVSIAGSLGGPFGAGLMVRGFLLNRALADFPPDGPDAMRAGTQPPSPLAPAIVLDEEGHLFAVLAGLTGPLPHGNLAQAITGLVDWRLPADGALDLPLAAGPPGAVPVALQPHDVSANKIPDAMVNAH